MVIQGTTGTGGPTGNIHPVSFCTWSEVLTEDVNGYTITNAQFWPGAGALGAPIAITGARIGFIGKSGRFVATSN